MPKDYKAFKRLLLECIDEGLGELGESAKKAVYFHLEERYGLTKENICDEIKKFSKSLRSIFGEGAKVIEKLILQKLCGKTGYKPEKDLEHASFQEIILKAKEYLEKN